MIFRRANPEDAETISSLIMLFRDSLTVDPSGVSAERFFASVSVEAERSYMRSDRYDYLVAEIEGELAGIIAMRDQTHPLHLFVFPKYQRRGLARELWRQAREAAVSRNAVKEFTVNSSLPAVPVYERLGFERISPPMQEHGVVFIRMRYTDGDNAA